LDWFLLQMYKKERIFKNIFGNNADFL